MTHPNVSGGRRNPPRCSGGSAIACPCNDATATPVNWDNTPCPGRINKRSCQCPPGYTFGKTSFITDITTNMIV